MYTYQISIDCQVSSRNSVIFPAASLMESYITIISAQANTQKNNAHANLITIFLRHNLETRKPDLHNDKFRFTGALVCWLISYPSGALC